MEKSEPTYARDARVVADQIFHHLHELKAGPAGICAYGLVRGRNGLLRVDDLNLMPLQIWESLSDTDREYLLSVHGTYTPIYR
jgi:hypothetical protein